MKSPPRKPRAFFEEMIERYLESHHGRAKGLLLVAVCDRTRLDFSNLVTPDALSVDCVAASRCADGKRRQVRVYEDKEVDFDYLVFVFLSGPPIGGSIVVDQDTLPRRDALVGDEKDVRPSPVSHFHKLAIALEPSDHDQMSGCPT
jgi:hypothetical protein